MDMLLVLVVCYTQSTFAIFINGYDILVAEVGSCVSSAGNTVQLQLTFLQDHENS